MIIIFDPHPPFLQWHKIQNENHKAYTCEFKPGWADRVSEDIGDYKRVTAIGYVLYHGGEAFDHTVTRITPTSLLRIEKSVAYLPEYNEMTLKVVQHWTQHIPDILHLLFCETAFFTDLPPEASNYAIPYEWRASGIRRYGGFGLAHQRAWERTRLWSRQKPHKMISLYLGEYTNLAAIKEGAPVETSIGFTPVGGLISPESCGEIDPTVVFQLSSAGMSFREINDVLSGESGFKALLGKKCGFLDVMRNPVDPEERFCKDVFLYAILKTIGAFIATLGGVDAIIVTSEHLKEASNFITDVLRGLEFLGLKRRDKTDGDLDGFKFTKHASPIQALGFQYQKERYIAERINTVLKQEIGDG